MTNFPDITVDSNPPDLQNLAVEPSFDLFAHESDDSGRTDEQNAERFIDKNLERLMYVPEWRRWLVWDGRRWYDDNGVGVRRHARYYVKNLWNELGKKVSSVSRDEFSKIQTFVKRSNSAAGIKALIDLARSDPRIVCPVKDLNRHLTLLNVENGTIDLATGKFRDHDPADRITQLAPVRFDPAATCPEWLATLELVFNSDQGLIRYVQQLLGYSCSGLVDHHVLPICWGNGNNGKSTISGTIVNLLGDYAKPVSQDLLLPVQQQHPTIIADLYQRRFCPLAEIDQNRKLNEAIAKMLTGGDKLTGRRCGEDFWDFDPTHKFWLSCNHKPRISGTDEGIWRRVRLIPFTVDISKKTKPKPGLSKSLVRNEGPGILNWLIAGFKDYYEHELVEPDCVMAATNDYRDSEDVLGLFIKEHCVVELGGTATAEQLFVAFKNDFGGKWTKTAFGKAISERFKKEKAWEGINRGKVVYEGIRVKTNEEELFD
ncbi:MAG: phage/plasmid primase, P4 family [Pirellulaceae bacterium]|nr:phage/plasmid primase, P4 family [Pirellulaceae bacterium]